MTHENKNNHPNAIWCGDCGDGLGFSFAFNDIDQDGLIAAMYSKYIREDLCGEYVNKKTKTDPETIAPMPESDLLRIRIELEALITEREGMIAENKRQAFINEYHVQYAEDSFKELAQKITALLERIK